MPLFQLRSLRYRLSALILGLILVMLMGSGWAATMEVRRTALADASDRLQRLTTQMAQMLGSSAAQLRGQTKGLRENAAIQRFLGSGGRDGRDSTMSILRAVAASSARTNVLWMELWDSAGKRIATSLDAAPALPTDRAHEMVTVVEPGGDAIGPVHSMGDSVAYPTISRLDADSHTEGFVVVWRRLAAADAPRQFRELLGSNAALFVGNKRGDVWSNMVRPVSAPPVNLDSMNTVVVYDRSGEQQLAFGREIAGTPWMLVIEFPRALVLAPVRRTLGRLGIFALLLLVSGSAGAWFLLRGLTRPIASLADAAGAMSSGNYDHRVRIERGDELGALGSAFNRMADTVADGRRQLQTHAAELEVRAATLAQVSAELDATLGSAPVGIAFLDPSLRFRRVNDRLVSISDLGAEQHLGRTLAEVLPELAPLIEPHMRRALESGQGVFDVEIAGETRARPGVTCHWLTSYFPVRTNDGHLLGVGVMLMDLTEYKVLEMQLLHAQKIEAVGRLAGGIAHDFNNILTAISSFSELAIGSLPLESPVRSDIEQIRHAAGRATTLTRQLLAFSRQQVLQPRVLDLNTVVSDIDPMLRRLIGEDITLHFVLEPDLWPVRADRGQLEQVLVNLVVNARDAMPNGGSLVVGTSMSMLDETYVQDWHHGASPGPHVVLLVTDDGAGMDAATKARIFEPFFSTKAPGKGTGLGLAMVYGVVKQSGGSIWVYSEAGRGTTFKIYLPRYVGAADAAVVETAPMERAPRSANILLVEDELPVRMVARRILERDGYRVLEATDGRNALDIATRLLEPIDLVITDLVMPGMGGRELVRQLRMGTHPARVLFMSGYAMDAVNRLSLLEASDAFIEKPFTVDTLSRKVKEVLAA